MNFGAMLHCIDTYLFFYDLTNAVLVSTVIKRPRVVFNLSTMLQWSDIALRFSLFALHINTPSTFFLVINRASTTTVKAELKIYNLAIFQKCVPLSEDR